MTHFQITDTPPRNAYVADGVETIFVYDFQLFNEDDLEVIVDEVPALAGDYTITGLRDTAGGTVVFDSAPADGADVVLYRNSVVERLADFQTSGPLRANTLNDELDYITALIQEWVYQQKFAVSEDPRYGTPGALTLPNAADRANKVLVFDGTGAATTGTDAPDFKVSYTDPPITLVDGQSDYNLPASVQSDSDQDNYRVRFIDGGELTRNDDFTVSNNVLTLVTTPTTANGLAGEDIEVTLVKPGIDASAVAPGSVTSNSIAPGAVTSDALGFPGQALGTILYNDGTDWLVLDPPSSDGVYKLNLTVSGGAAAIVPGWVQGGVLIQADDPVYNNSVAPLTDTIVDNNNRLTDSEGTFILEREITVLPGVTKLEIEARAYVGMQDATIARMGVFITGTTSSLAEDLVWQPSVTGANGMHRMAVDFSHAYSTEGVVTIFVRVGTTRITSYLNALADGQARAGGGVRSSLVVRQLGTNS